MAPIVRLHLPSVAFRLSDLQRQTIRPGLVRIVVATRRELEGLSPSPEIPITFPLPRHGVFWPFFGQLVSNLWVRSYEFFKSFGRCRFRADFLEISILALAARGSKPFVAECGHYAESARRGAVRTRLLQRLRQIRRRAAMLVKKNLGEQSFRELMQRWMLFADWARFWALTPRYTNPIQKFALVHRRWIITAAVQLAHDELVSRNITVPSDSDLRRFVRLAIREVRRHRKGFGIRTLLHEPSGRDFLVDFIVKRLGRQLQDLSQLPTGDANRN